MKKHLSILFVVAGLFWSAAPALGDHHFTYCGDLEAVANGEITMSEAMLFCLPNVKGDVGYAGLISAEESYELVTDPETRHDWIILDVRRLPEYLGNISQVVNQGHPMWLKKGDKEGVGRGNYEHSYLAPWLDAPSPPLIVNLEFWGRVQELEEAGVIQWDRTNIIVMCRTGWLAHGAANFLAAQGYSAYNMVDEGIGLETGGYSAWQTIGLPTTCNSGDDHCINAPQYSGINLNDF